MRLPTGNLVRILVVAQGISLVAMGMMAIFLARSSTSTSPQYPYIAKRLFVEHPNDIIINFTVLREKLEKYTSDSKEKIGVYFEYLPTGNSININSRDEFYRASLVKLPVVMRAYKYIEEKKLSLDESLTIEEKQLNRQFGTLWKRGAGSTITVRELIKYILDDSDNTAFNVLYEKVNVQLGQDAPSGDKSSDDIYDYLDIPRAATGITPMISPKNYTSILKSLFFSAYLTFHDSNEILKIMTEPHSENWLRAGVRAGVPVANKIGVYELDPVENHVYADCGIVFYPQRTYSLCVMVNSNDGIQAIEHIQNISQIVFTYLDTLAK